MKTSRSHRIKRAFALKSARLACLAAALLLAVACEQIHMTTQDIQETIQTGFEIAGKKEEGQKYGAAAGNLAGAFAPIPLENEVAIGEAISASAYDSIGHRFNDEVLQHYVNLVGRSLARHSDRPEVTYSFAVVSSPEVNAFSGPGGFVMVTSGLIARVQDESELAGILAHEIAHVSQRHMLKTMKREQFFSGVTQAATATKEKLAKYTQAVNSGKDLLFNRGFDQSFEYEADAVGTRLAAATGYDPAGLSHFLSRLEPGQRGGLFQTHPPAATRASKLNALLAGELAGYTGAVNRERFKQSTAAMAYIK